MVRVPLEEAGQILFCGAMSVVLGVLGMAVGLVVVARAIQRVGEVDSALVWSGVGVSLIPLIFGLLIFLFAASRGWRSEAGKCARSDGPSRGPDESGIRLAPLLTFFSERRLLTLR